MNQGGEKFETNNDESEEKCGFGGFCDGVCGNYLDWMQQRGNLC